MLEGTITETADNLPAIRLALNNLWQLLVLLVLQIVVRILHKVLTVDVLAIQLDPNSTVSDASQIVHTLGH